MRLAVTLFLLGKTTLAIGDEVVTTHDRLQFNWSTMQLSFDGLASGTDLTLSVLEEQAWHNGFTYLQKKLPTIYQQQGLSAGKREVYDRSTAIFRALHLRETVFSSQQVQIGFLTTLPPLFILPSLSLSVNTQTTKTRNSAIVLRVANDYPPRAVYRIEDQQGRLLFTHTMVKQTSFARQLMGRYFRATNQLPRIVGKNPQVIDAQPLVSSGKRLTVASQIWQQAVQGNESLLSDAKIVIIFPPAR